MPAAAPGECSCEAVPRLEFAQEVLPTRATGSFNNRFPKTVYGMLREKKGPRDAVVFSRSSTVGTQQFPVNWGGDNDSSYISMAESLRGGLSFYQSGFGFWAHDISGFEGTATPDLYKRWSAFGLLSTHSRLHGQESYRVPWCFDEESCRVLACFTKLKCSLMPYLFAQSVAVNRTGVPAMRAMMLEFPQDSACLTLDRQYMLGGSLLVAPIFREDGLVEFCVPEGCVWTNYLDGERLEGGRWYRRTYGYFHLPLLVRPGALIANGAVEDTPSYDYAAGVTFQLFALEGGKRTDCTLYDTQVRETVRAVAERSGDTIRFQVFGQAADWSLQLMGINQVAAVSGGSVQNGGNDVRIRAKGACEIAVTL